MAQGGDDERRSPRSKVLLSAVLEWPDRTLPVVLRDLSEHGALVESTEPISDDSAVFLQRNDLRVRGYVAWVRGRFAGISFGRPLKAEVVLRHIARPIRREVDQNLHRRPAVASSNMSPEEQRWFDEIREAPATGKRRG
jgi:hypothetical protein